MFRHALRNTLFFTTSLAMQAGTVAYAESNERRRSLVLKKESNGALVREFQPLSEVNGFYESAMAAPSRQHKP